MCGLGLMHSVGCLILFALSTGRVFGENDAANKTVCYDELGCFPTSDPWSSVFRPAFPAPESPEEIGFTLTFFTRNTGRSILDGHTLGFWPEIKFNDTDFDVTRPKTYFITHGFFASGNSTWMSEMKDALLKKEDANVFIVDWGKGASTINYFQAASNTRVVGAEIARFIDYAKKKYKMDPGRIHLIGHSLGAHISSYAAKRVPGIGRVTGLDPAQPGFEGTPKEVRLDKSDAQFVDVFHTNIRPVLPTLGFGMISAVGHVDIYFNGGLDQPECLVPKNVPIASLADIAKIKFRVLSHYISCSHTKAYQYFTATINSDCNIWARRAGTLRSLVNAVTFGNIEPITASVLKCSKKACTASGFLAPLFAARGVFAANTLSGSPFCDTNPDLDKRILNEIGLEGENDEETETESSTDKESSKSTTSKIPQVFKTIKSDAIDKPADTLLSKTKSIASKLPFV
ncbi:inactive pancreatic lipase-related protein 1 isoform X2 [Nilaparvata lugens]|nr:inactive pancreatic lipase-related protein 1 isoform X2 [Nilaparvata lugens]XP_039285257.1 inactive pancreatic lipase-related protein 1 isoform X2 [Nilaparvata lugens]